MKIFNLIKLSVASLALVALSGCVNSKAVSASGSEYYTAETVSSQHALHNAVSVSTTGFLETSRSAFSSQNKSNLNNEDAKTAIENSLENAGLLASTDGSYNLTAKLVDADLGNIWVNKVNERDIVIEYTLVDSAGVVVYNNVITGEGRRDYRLFDFNLLGKEQLTATKAYQDNFRQLIEDLRKL